MATPSVFIGGQQGFPNGLTTANKLNFAPRAGISHSIPSHGLVLHAAFGIFFTPVDMNTWCNQRHNVPYVFPETQQSDNFTPAPGIVATHFNFGPAVLGMTTVSFAAVEAESAAAIHPAVEWFDREESRSRDDAGTWLPGIARSAFAAQSSDQQRAARSGRNRTTAALQDAELSCQA